MTAWHTGSRLVGLGVVPAVTLWLAFASGGYFPGPQHAVTVVCWVAAGLVALAAPQPPAFSRYAQVALGALLALAGWTWASAAWAPVADLARDAAVLVLLYAGALAVLLVALTQNATAARRGVTPTVVIIAAVVTAYGLSGRWLPSIVDLTETVSAAGRLDQPLTYWNAQGLVSGLGVVGAVGLAADRTRPDVVRGGALGLSVVLVLGLWMTYSRGALLATAVGIGVVWWLGPRGPVVRTTAVVALAASPPVGVTAFLDGVRTLDGSAAAQTSQGAILLVLTVLGSVFAVLARAWVLRASDEHATRRLGRGAGVAVAAVVLAALALLTVAGDDGPKVGTPTTGATAERLASSDSNRYAYWEVALRSTAEAPLRGHGAGSFSTTWARERTIDDRVRDAHSLPLEVLSELGVVGLLLLVAFAAAVILAARGADGSEPEAACWIAIAAAWAVHVCIDWTWEMPAATLLGLIAIVAVISTGRPEGRAPRADGRSSF